MSGADDWVGDFPTIPILPPSDGGGDEDPVTLRYLKVWPLWDDNRKLLRRICKYLRFGNENGIATVIHSCSSNRLLQNNDHAHLIEIRVCDFEVTEDEIGFIEFDIRPYLELEGTTEDTAEQILATLCKELAFFFYYRMKGQRVPPPWTDLKLNEFPSENQYVVTGIGHAKTTLPRAKQVRTFRLSKTQEQGIYEINFSCINVDIDDSGGDSMDETDALMKTKQRHASYGPRDHCFVQYCPLKKSPAEPTRMPLI